MDHFAIYSEHSGYVLDIEHGTKKGGAKFIVRPYHGGANQQFRFNSSGFIESVHSLKVLDVEGNVHQGCHVVQWPSHGGENQKWRFHKDGTIRLEGHNLVLDIEGASCEKGTKIIVWPFHGGSNQLWRVVNKWDD